MINVNFEHKGNIIHDLKVRKINPEEALNLGFILPIQTHESEKKKQGSLFDKILKSGKL